MRFLVLVFALALTTNAFAMNKKEMAEKLASTHSISFQQAMKAITVYENFVATSLRGGFAVTSPDAGYLRIDSKLRSRIPQHNPEWTDHNGSDPGRTLESFQIVMIPAKKHLKRLYKDLMRNYLDKASPILAQSLKQRGVQVPTINIVKGLNQKLRKNVISLETGDVVMRKRPGRTTYAGITQKRTKDASEMLGKELGLNGLQQRVLNNQLSKTMGSFFQAIEANLRLAEFKKKVKRKTMQDLKNLLMFLPDATPLRVAKDLMFGMQMRTLAVGERVMQPKFGVMSLDFDIRKVKRNVNGVSTLFIEAKTYPFFKPMKGLKDRVAIP